MATITIQTQSRTAVQRLLGETRISQVWRGEIRRERERERWDGIDYWRQALQYEYERLHLRVPRLVWWSYRIHEAWLRWLTLRMCRRHP